MAAQQNNMEEILTSIRTTLAEETAKVGTPAPAATGLEEISDEEVLALSEADVASNGEEMVDLAAFGQQGEVKMKPASSVAAAADVLGEGQAPAAAPTAAAPAPTSAPAAPAKADELDKLIADIATAPAPVAPVEAPAAAATPNGEASDVVPLGLVGDVADLQVALPAEVLAAALRPLVQNWLEQNLPTVVERLIQAEISKLANPDQA